MEEKEENKEVYLSGIPYDISEEEIRKHFEDCGEIVSHNNQSTQLA